MENFNQFSIEVARNIEEPMHLHPDVEVLYCLEGELEVQIRDKKYRMHKDDIIVVNSSIQHSLQSKGANIVCRVRYEYQILVEMISNTSFMFLCNSCMNKDKSYDSILEILREIVCLEVLYNRKTESYKYSLIYRLLDNLIESYMELHDQGQFSVKEYGSDEKLQKILYYIHQNYQTGVSLADLAEQMFTSKSTLSRFFKKQTGIYFAEYVNQVRLHYAIRELLFTDKNITKIAMDCGFSNASAFNKVFRENYDMAPTEYRQKKLEEIQAQKKEQQEIEQDLRKEFRKEMEMPEQRLDSDLLKINLNVNETRPNTTFWNEGINFGPLGNMSRANVQAQLLQIQEDLHPRHIRFWSVLSKKLYITDGQTLGRYNFTEIDSIFDFLVKNHIKPCLDFSGRYDIAVRSVGDIIFRNEDAVVFESREIWEDFFHVFIDHLVLRYGKQELENWVFEIMDQPFSAGDYPYYRDEHYDYRHAYDYAYDVLRRLSPYSRIVGCGIVSNGNLTQAVTFLKHCSETGRLPDSIAFGLYPYEPLTEDGSSVVRSADQNFECHEAEKLKKLLDQCHLPDLTITISEWNFTTSNRNFLNDSCFRGTYFLRTIAQIWDKVVAFNTWTGTDLVSSYMDANEICYGGTGLLTKDSIKKPIYFALAFLNRLGDQVISVGENYIATKVRDDEYEVLCFNFNWYSPGYFLQGESALRPEELDTIFPDHKELIIDLILKGVRPNSTFIVKRRTVNCEYGSILDAWGKFNYESRMTRNDIQYLRNICIPGLSMERHKANGSQLEFRLSLKEQEFSLFHIFREDM